MERETSHLGARPLRVVPAEFDVDIGLSRCRVLAPGDSTVETSDTYHDLQRYVTETRASPSIPIPSPVGL